MGTENNLSGARPSGGAATHILDATDIGTLVTPRAGATTPAADTRVEPAGATTRTGTSTAPGSGVVSVLDVEASLGELVNVPATRPRILAQPTDARPITDTLHLTSTDRTPGNLPRLQEEILVYAIDAKDDKGAVKTTYHWEGRLHGRNGLGSAFNGDSMERTSANLVFAVRGALHPDLAREGLASYTYVTDRSAEELAVQVKEKFGGTPRPLEPSEAAVLRRAFEKQ